jgi:hypothetical protein
MNIIYDDCPWERQFLFQDLFNAETVGNYKIIDNIDYGNIGEFQKLDLHEIVDNNILVFSSNLWDYVTVLSLVTMLKPKIIVHLSDEHGDRTEFQELAKHCELLLRQYHFTDYPQYKNIKHIPLGYSSGMFETNYLELPVKTARERKFKWSWVGTVHHGSGRRSMLKKFRKLRPNRNGQMDNVEMRELYRDSIFTPCGRGHSSLDCFRLYEASACGTIPIVVGSDEEIGETFMHQKNPPWLFFESWDEAVTECGNLVNNLDYLDNMSMDLFKWWKARVEGIRNEIRLVCKGVTV